MNRKLRNVYQNLDQTVQTLLSTVTKCDDGSISSLKGHDSSIGIYKSVDIVDIHDESNCH